MARFLIRNYGPSRQIPYKGHSICLSRDQAIETDEVELAVVMKEEKNIYVNDRGAEFAAPVLPKKTEKPDDKKERPVTVDNAEAVHAENFPDEDEQPKIQPPAPVVSTEDKDEIAYADMTVKELQVLAKDRQIKTSGLKKAELIQALEDYDKEG